MYQMSLLRPDPEPLYDDDLTTFVAAALRDDTVDAIIDATENEDPVTFEHANTDAEPYVEKMLDEEIQKQFGDPERSLVDLALNSVDARPEDKEDYTVRLYNTPWSFTVSDEGEGMDAGTVVERLLVPFSTDKDSTKDIGRFGVGFYSSLEHILANPDTSTVAVSTNTGDDQYRLEFYSTGDSVSDLQLKLEPGSRRNRGTTVSVKHPNASRSDIASYIDDYLGQMDPERVTFKGLFRQKNTLPDGEEHRGQFEYDGKDHDVVAITDPDSIGNSITITSQGVQIMEKSFTYGNVHINLPPVVDLVEGRNAFKQDEIYEQAIDTVYDAIAADIDTDTRTQFVEQLFPRLEDELDVSVDSGLKADLADSMDKGQYLIKYRGDHSSDMQGDRVKRFVDGAVRDEIFTQIGHTEDFWREVYDGLDALMEDYTEPVETLTGIDVDRKYAGFFEDTGFIPRESPNAEQVVKVDHDQPGPSPFLQTDDTLYIVADHPLYQDDSLEARHTLSASYQENRGKRLGDVDDTLVYQA